MTLKRLVIGFALVFLAALAWRLRLLDVLTGLAAPPRPAPVQIKFDNGSVRDTTPTVKVDPKSLPAPIGVLRKCLHGQQVSYTNSFCPPGTREAPLSKGTVNVVAGGVEAKPPAGGGGQPGPLEPTAQEKLIERVVNPR
jgi:hypothetical protein